jgi:hypothetical protein
VTGLTSEQQLEMFSNVEVIKANCVRCMDCQKDHEKRIRGLENFRWWMLGGCGVVMWVVEHFLH